MPGGIDLTDLGSPRLPPPLPGESPQAYQRRVARLGAPGDAALRDVGIPPPQPRYAATGPQLGDYSTAVAAALPATIRVPPPTETAYRGFEPWIGGPVRPIPAGPPVASVPSGAPGPYVGPGGAVAPGLRQPRDPTPYELERERLLDLAQFDVDWGTPPAQITPNFNPGTVLATWDPSAALYVPAATEPLAYPYRSLAAEGVFAQAYKEWSGGPWLQRWIHRTGPGPYTLATEGEEAVYRLRVQQATGPTDLLSARAQAGTLDIAMPETSTLPTSARLVTRSYPLSAYAWVPQKDLPLACPYPYGHMPVPQADYASGRWLDPDYVPSIPLPSPYDATPWRCSVPATPGSTPPSPGREAGPFARKKGKGPPGPPPPPSPKGIPPPTGSIGADLEQNDTGAFERHTVGESVGADGQLRGGPAMVAFDAGGGKTVHVYLKSPEVSPKFEPRLYEWRGTPTDVDTGLAGPVARVVHYTIYPRTDLPLEDQERAIRGICAGLTPVGIGIPDGICGESVGMRYSGRDPVDRSGFPTGDRRTRPTRQPNESPDHFAKRLLAAGFPPPAENGDPQLRTGRPKVDLDPRPLWSGDGTLDDYCRFLDRLRAWAKKHPEWGGTIDDIEYCRKKKTPLPPGGVASPDPPGGSSPPPPPPQPLRTRRRTRADICKLADKASSSAEKSKGSPTRTFLLGQALILKSLCDSKSKVGKGPDDRDDPTRIDWLARVLEVFEVSLENHLDGKSLKTWSLKRYTNSSSYHEAIDKAVVNCDYAGPWWNDLDDQIAFVREYSEKVHEVNVDEFTSLIMVQKHINSDLDLALTSQGIGTDADWRALAEVINDAAREASGPITDRGNPLPALLRLLGLPIKSIDTLRDEARERARDDLRMRLGKEKDIRFEGTMTKPELPVDAERTTK